MQPLEATAQIAHAHCEYTERIRLGILEPEVLRIPARIAHDV